MRNLKIASAVALALGGGAGAAQATPTLAQCQAPAATLYVAGSSAAQNAFANALNGADLFNGTEATYSSGSNANFKAYCGSDTGNKLGFGSNATILVHYRAEGGSVVGALPVLSGKPIKFLDLTNPAVTGTSITVTGSSASNGTNDSWTGPLTGHTVEVGITDVEPAQFVGSNYPSAYSAAVFGGPYSGAQLGSLSKTKLFDQVFGLFVNTSGINGGGTGQTINLSRETVGKILTENYTDWSQVPSATGGRVSNTALGAAPITVYNREAGSGTRTGASVYFLNYNCSPLGSAIPENGIADGFATGDVLTSASGTAGAITYASIDQSKANLNLAQLAGVSPSNLAATSGQYDWWYEAQIIKGPTISSAGTTIYNFLVPELQSLKTAPHAADVLVIPGAGSPANAITVPVTADTSQPGAAIYVNPFTRGSNSCNTPQ